MMNVDIVKQDQKLSQPGRKSIVVSLICLLILTSCLSDEEKRLQTDQTFEGQEMFNLSFSLDEHVSYAFQPYSFYKDTVNHSAIPGCPSIEIGLMEKKVVLNFGGGDCESNSSLRGGKLMLSYPDTLKSGSPQIKIAYENYIVKGIKVEGSRSLYAIDSSSAGIILLDSVTHFMITDGNKSTSKIEAVFQHEVLIENDSIQSFTTTGSGLGRNLAGRPYQMEVTQKKKFSGKCIQTGFVVAESGQENWVFERTAEANVIHTINFQIADDCNHTAKISLSDGSELSKKQK